MYHITHYVSGSEIFMPGEFLLILHVSDIALIFVYLQALQIGEWK